MSKWHSGPPPSPGWWPASIDGYDTSKLHFWWPPKDGEPGWWGVACRAENSIRIVELRAARKSVFQRYIKWQHRPDNWPERSRT